MSLDIAEDKQTKYQVNCVFRVYLNITKFFSKNVILKYARDEKVELVDGLYDLSPPINSKIS